MLLKIIGFESRYRLRQAGFYVSLAVFAALGAFYAYAGTVGPENGPVRPANDPFGIAFWLTSATLLAAYLPLSSSADAVRRDAATGMADLIRATPAPDWMLLLGRFVVALAATALAFLVAAAAFEILVHMPWVDPKLAGPFRPDVYGRAFLLMVLPTLFSLSALSALVAAQTRSTYSPFLLLILTYLLYAASRLAAGRLGSLWLSLDPFGLAPFLAATERWTNIERATLQIPAAGPLLINRLLWCAIGLLSLVAACALAARRDGSGWPLRRRNRAAAGKPAETGTPAAQIDMPAPSRALPGSRVIVIPADTNLFEAIRMRLRFELARLLRSWLSVFLLALPVLVVIPVLYFADTSDDVHLFPVTAAVAKRLSMAVVIPLSLFCILFAGEMVWRERNARMSELIDATMTPGLVYLSTKLAALAAVITIQLAIVTGVGIGYQIYHRVPQIDLSYYAAELVVTVGWPLVLTSVVVMLVHVIAPNRTVGHLLALSVVIGLASVEFLGVEHRLLRFADPPDIALSDMNGVGQYLKAPLWFLAYWTSIAFILLLLADVMRERMAGTPLTLRLRGILHAPRPVVIACGTALLLAIATGGFIIWNVHFLNEYTTAAAQEKNAVEFERIFAPQLDALWPRVTAIDIAVDLFPEDRSYKVRGQMVLKNTTGQPISTFPVAAGADVRLTMTEPMDIERPGRAPCCDIQNIRLGVPMQPDEVRTLSFAASIAFPGFRNRPDPLGIEYNGTFLNRDDLVPAIGFGKESFLQDERKRLAYGLSPLDDTPAPADPRPWRRNYVNRDADYIDFAITVSTSPDQIAVAPGYLQREWSENGRRYFRYEMDRKIVNFWSVASARYEVARDRWNDVELAVYYHAPHSANVAAMIEAIKLTLDYATQAFGPYQYRQMRIVEFPYGNFAQSFPNTVPFSENAGFISDPRAVSGFAYGVMDLTAHEVAHQWWAHQVISADVPGAVFLSETLAEYTMLMVMQRRFGADLVRRLVRRDVNTYLKSRGTGTEERPLLRVKPGQSEIAYQKGGAAMYALQWAVGEETVNRALARFITEYREKSDPYPGAADLVRLLKEEAGPAYNELIGDLFERITLWDFTALKSTASRTDDGKWKVRLNVSARKIEADPNGAEEERPLDQTVEVALFKADPAVEGTGQSNRIGLFRQHIETGTSWLELIADAQPAFVAINPFVGLIQRDTTENAVRIEIVEEATGESP